MFFARIIGLVYTIVHQHLPPPDGFLGRASGPKGITSGSHPRKHMVIYTVTLPRALSSSFLPLDKTYPSVPFLFHLHFSSTLTIRATDLGRCFQDISSRPMEIQTLVSMSFLLGETNADTLACPVKSRRVLSIRLDRGLAGRPSPIG